MDNAGNFGTKKALLSYLQPGCQGNDEENTELRGQVMKSAQK